MVISYIAGLIVTLILGYIYSIITVFIPFIYFTVIATIGFGMILGIFCRAMILVSHNRNRRNLLTYAVIIGILANYFQWTAYLVYAYNGEIPSFSEYLAGLTWVAVPENFIGAIKDINAVGLWSVFGITFNGLALTFIWLLEAFIIIAGPVLAVYKAESHPYAESESRWYPKYTLNKDFESLSASETLINSLHTDPAQTVRRLGTGSAYRFTKIHVFYLESEKEQYLSFERVFFEERGKGKKNSEVIIKNLAIDNEAATNILNAFQHEKARTSWI